jgi:hypothetical protein
MGTRELLAVSVVLQRSAASDCIDFAVFYRKQLSATSGLIGAAQPVPETETLHR